MYPINMVSACLGLDKRQWFAVQINVLAGNLTGALVDLREQLTVVAVEIDRRLTVNGLLDPLADVLHDSSDDQRVEIFGKTDGKDKKPTAHKLCVAGWVLTTEKLFQVLLFQS